MIKNIKIFAGSTGFEYIANSFFENNKQLLKKQAITSCSIADFLREDFFPEARYARLDLSAMFSLEPSFTWENAFAPLEILKQKFAHLEEETLVITCDRRLLNPKHHDFFKYLYKIFVEDVQTRETKIVLDVHIINLDLVLETSNLWITQVISGIPSSIKNLLAQNFLSKALFFSGIHTTPHVEKQCQNIAENFSKNAFIFKNIEQTFCKNEANIISSILDVLKIDFPYNFLKHVENFPTQESFIFAPEVLSFISAIYAYCSEIKTINWFSQTKFLQFKTNSSQPYTYVSEYAAKKLYEKFWLVTDLQEHAQFAVIIELNRQIKILKEKQVQTKNEQERHEVSIKLDAFIQEHARYIKKIRERVGEKGGEKAQEFLSSREFLQRPNVYDAPNIVTKEDAFVLGNLLEKDFRQFLLQKLVPKDSQVTSDARSGACSAVCSLASSQKNFQKNSQKNFRASIWENLIFQSQSIRNVFAALLKIEEEIDETEYLFLTKTPQGTVLTGDFSCKDKSLQTPKVTVLTQTYNHEKFIEKQIQSVIAQKTDFPVSHIIIDDCSTDGTRDILRKYAKIFPHITLILRVKNKIAHALYAMFDQVTSPFVSICDGDDYFIHPEKLQRQVKNLEENQDFALTFHFTEFVYLDMEDPEAPRVGIEEKSSSSNMTSSHKPSLSTPSLTTFSGKNLENKPILGNAKGIIPFAGDLERQSLSNPNSNPNPTQSLDTSAWRTNFHPRNWPEGKKFIRLAELLKSNCIQTNSVMYRWRFSHGMPMWFSKQICPGDWYWHILHAQNGKIGFEPEVMSAYVRHPNGLFAQTCHSIGKHRRKFGKAEVLFYEIINLHFAEHYQRAMRNKQATIFGSLEKDALLSNDFSYYLDFCKTYPFLCDEFDISLEIY